MGSLFIAILVIIVLISLYYRGREGEEQREQTEKETIARLKARYQDALGSGDKAVARRCGHDYYAYLRGSRTLPAIDEQAIESDLATIQ